MTLTWRTSTFRTTLTCERELVKCTGEMWYRTAGSFGHRNLARPTPSAWSVLVRPVRMGIPSHVRFSTVQGSWGERARQAGRPELRRVRLDSPLNLRGPTPDPLSAKLSQLAAFSLREPTIKPRRIAILVVDDFNHARVDGTPTALKAGMVTMWIVGPCWRPVCPTGDGRSKAYPADHHYGGQRSALFDAIVVASSAANARTGHWARAWRPALTSTRLFRDMGACAGMRAYYWAQPATAIIPQVRCATHARARPFIKTWFHLHEANTTTLSLHFRICGLDTSHNVWFATGLADSVNDSTLLPSGGLGLDLLLIARPDMMSISHDYGVFIEDEGMIALRGLFLIDSMKVSSAYVRRLITITINNLPINRSVEEMIRLVKAFQITQWMRLSSSVFPVAAPADLSFSLAPPSPSPFVTQPQEEHGEE
ncbi:uncharacterized protein BXZ73DRAFT_79263 [Epithele typhae]|uniref:uncharacterized protein n=1 Tax=Epithele typhae TaxID=378194 RepID=UPI00200741CF|nr:uncharacterized protein BXZ73DRAFT_79263 [Epithele typhae]KAH9924291.1 hypothetical protein BXZ73DRAFT_79263 [Epithele typhae]